MSELLSGLFLSVLFIFGCPWIFYYLAGRDKRDSAYKSRKSLIVFGVILILIAFANFFGMIYSMASTGTTITKSRELMEYSTYIPPVYTVMVDKFTRSTILFLCWGVYAINYNPSNTNGWQKFMKVMAYIIMSLFLPAIPTSLRENILTVDFMITFAVVLFIVVTLLKFSKSPKEKEAVDENSL